MDKHLKHIYEVISNIAHNNNMRIVFALEVTKEDGQIDACAHICGDISLNTINGLQRELNKKCEEIQSELN